MIAFIMLCAFQPKLTEDIANFLYSEEKNTDNPSTQLQAKENTLDTFGSNMNEEAVSTERIKSIVSTVPNDDQYVVNDESEITPSENVVDRNGYEPIVENAEEIAEEDGEKLAEIIGYGETGEGLEFDTRFHPYYVMLNNTLKSLYRQIYANAMAVNPTFAPIEVVSVDQLKDVFTAVFGDHPELFWLDTAYECKYLPNGKCVQFSLQFNHTATNLEINKQEFENSANNIIQGTTDLDSDYDKEVYIHDTLISKIEYNLSAPLNQSAYSALVSGQTVCAGYARAYQYLMQKIGIPCYYCMGFAGEKHAWNIVSLDNEYYYVDTTWDDTNPNTYDYFNKSDKDYNSSHIREDLSIYLPACNGQNYRDLEITNIEEPVIDKRQSLQDFGFTIEDIKYSLEDYYEDCYDQVMRNGMGSYNFNTIISSKEIFNQILEAISNKTYFSGYADRALLDLGANKYYIEAYYEELQDGYYIISNIISIQ